MSNIPKILERAIFNLKREGLTSYFLKRAELIYYHYLKRRLFNISWILFAVHEFWISILYGKTGDYFVFNISDSLRDRLISFFLEQEFANYKDWGSDEENLLMFNSLSYETRSRLDENIRVWNF